MGLIYGDWGISEKLQLDGGRSTRELHSANDEELDYVLDLRSVLKAVLKWSWIMIVFAIVGLAYGVTETAKFVPQYTAKMVIAPQSSEGSGGGDLERGGAAGGGSSITTTLMAALGGAGTKSGGLFERLQFALKSPQLARRLDEKHNLSREIFASRWAPRKAPGKCLLKPKRQLDVGSMRICIKFKIPYGEQKRWRGLLAAWLNSGH